MNDETPTATQSPAATADDARPEVPEIAPEIAVVVPAYRAEDTVGACLDALLAAGFSSDAITVVDDGSPDGTVAAVRAKGIEPITPPGGNAGAARARNAGVAAAADGGGADGGGAEIVFFVDADVVVHDDVKDRLTRFFRDHPDHAGVIGSYDAAPPAPGRVSRIRNLLHHHVHQVSAGDQPTFWTGCGAIRRADFEAAGGFRTEDERIEDVGLGLRLARMGRRVRLDPDIRCTHLKRWSLRDMAVTDYRHRAIPWTRMLSDPANADIPPALNAGRTGRLSVLATGATILGLALALLAPVAGLAIAALAALALVLVNRGFLARVRDAFGPGDAVVALGVLWLHYLCAGAGYARVRALG